MSTTGSDRLGMIAIADDGIARRDRHSNDNDDGKGQRTTVDFVSSSASKTRIAERCRRAGVEFMNGAMRWSSRELVLWLVGTYHTASRSYASTLPVALPHASPSPRRSPRSAAREGSEPLTRLIAAHVDVLRTMSRYAKHGNWPTLAAKLAEKRALTIADSWQTNDRSSMAFRLVGNGQFWQPVDSAHLMLRDRVLSLFVTDLTIRSEDYASPILCSGCGGLRISRRCVRGCM